MLDWTGLPGSYDLSIDLTTLLAQSQEYGEHPDIAGMIATALAGC